MDFLLSSCSWLAGLLGFDFFQHFCVCFWDLLLSTASFKQSFAISQLFNLLVDLFNAWWSQYFQGLELVLDVVRNVESFLFFFLLSVFIFVLLALFGWGFFFDFIFLWNKNFNFFLFPLWVSSQFSVDIYSILNLVFSFVCSVEILFNTVQVLDQLIAQFDFSNVLLQLFLLFELFIFSFVLLSSLFSLGFVDLSGFDLHLPFDPVNIVFLFPVSLFLGVEVSPELIVLFVELLYLLFNIIESLLLGFLPFFPFLWVLFLFLEEFFLVSVKVFLQSINGCVSLVKLIHDLFEFFFQRFFLFFEFFNFVIKLFLSFMSLLDFELNVSYTFCIIDLSLQQSNFVMKTLLLFLAQCSSHEPVFKGSKLFCNSLFATLWLSSKFLDSNIELLCLFNEFCQFFSLVISFSLDLSEFFSQFLNFFELVLEFSMFALLLSFFVVSLSFEVFGSDLFLRLKKCLLFARSVWWSFLWSSFLFILFIQILAFLTSRLSWGVLEFRCQF